MSQENVEIVREMVAAGRRGDWKAAIALFHPDVELDASQMPDGGTYQGVEALQSFYTRWLGHWDKLEITPRRIVEVDADRVLVLVELRGIGRSSGVEVAMTVADLHTLRQGRIVQVTGYPDHREALEAVGLSEQDAHADSS